MKRFDHTVVGAGLLLAGLLAAGCSRNEYVRAMREAAEAFDDGRYSRAAGLFKETAASDSTFAAYYDYALASHAAGDDPEAIATLDTLKKREGFIPAEYDTDVLLNLANDVLTEAVRQKAKEAEAADGKSPAMPGNGGMLPVDPGMTPDGQPIISDTPEADVPSAGMQAPQQQPQSIQLFQRAVETYEEYLLREPDDLDAKERYLYAKSQLPPQQEGGGGGGGGGGGNDQNQDQQNQDQNQDQQDQNQQQNQQQDQQQQQLNEDQIYQLLEMKEKQTREKVDEKKQKAIMLRQKDKKKW